MLAVKLDVSELMYVLCNAGVCFAKDEVTYFAHRIDGSPMMLKGKPLHSSLVRHVYEHTTHLPLVAEGPLPITQLMPLHSDQGAF